MSRFVAFVFLFVIGALSSTSADESQLNEEFVLIANLWKRKYIGNLNSTIVSAKTKCDRENLASVSRAIDNNYNQLVTCFDENVNATELEGVTFNSFLSTDHTLLPKLICLRVPALVTCNYDLTNIVRPCLDDGENYLVDVAKNLTDTTLDFICREDQANFNNLISNGALQCLVDRLEGLKGCIRNMAQKYNYNYRKLSEPLNPSEPSDHSLVARCNFLSEVRTCMINDLRQCDNQSPANIIDRFLEALWKVSPCENPTVNTFL